MVWRKVFSIFKNSLSKDSTVKPVKRKTNRDILKRIELLEKRRREFKKSDPLLIRKTAIVNNFMGRASSHEKYCLSYVHQVKLQKSSEKKKNLQKIDQNMTKMDQKQPTGDQNLPVRDTNLPTSDKKLSKSDTRKNLSIHDLNLLKSDKNGPRGDEKSSESDKKILRGDESSSKSDKIILRGDENPYQSDKNIPKCVENSSESDNKVQIIRVKRKEKKKDNSRSLLKPIYQIPTPEKVLKRKKRKFKEENPTFLRKRALIRNFLKHAPSDEKAKLSKIHEERLVRSMELKKIIKQRKEMVLSLTKMWQLVFWTLFAELNKQY